MKSYLKFFLEHLTKFYIPTCIKGHSFLLHKLNNNPLILDIGMNKGEFSKIIKRENNKINISGIELDKDLTNQLINQEGIEVINKAVTGHDGYTEIFRINHKNNYEYYGELWSIINDSTWDVKETEIVECISLNSFIENTKRERDS